MDCLTQQEKKETHLQSTRADDAEDKTHEPASREKWQQQWQPTVLEQFYPGGLKCHL